MRSYNEYSKEELIRRIEYLEKQLVIDNQLFTESDSVETSDEDQIAIHGRMLHNPDNAYRFLMKTCDTLLLLTQTGLCVDAIVKLNYVFLENAQIIGYNIFDILPTQTGDEIKVEFDKVVANKISSDKDYELIIQGHQFYFKCTMQPDDRGFVIFEYRDITDRIQLRKNLEIVNLRLKETGEAAKMGQWATNSNSGIVTYYGNIGGVFDGYIDFSIPLDDYLKHVHPDDVDKVKTYMTGYEKGRDTLEYKVVKDQKLLYFRSKIIRVREIDGEKILEGYVQNITDIIERRNELEMVTNAVNRANDIIFGVDMMGKFVFANYLYRKYWSIHRDADIHVHSISEVDIFRHAHIAWDDIVNALKNKNNYKYQVEWISDSGKKNYFDCMAYKIKDDLGKDVIWCFWKNITKQTNAENQTKTTNRLLNAILENIPIFILVKDSANDFRYVYANKVARNSYILGVSSDVNPIGKNDFEILSQGYAECYREEDLYILETKSGRRRVREYEDAEGQLRTVDESRLMVQKEDNDSALIIHIGWDITELKQIQDELIKAKEKAEQSDKLKSAFLSNMSHEIRTPLNAIVGFSRIIAEIDDAAERKKYYDIVESNNTRLLALINEILDLSRIESGSVEFSEQVFNMNELLKELYENLSLGSTDRVKLVWQSNPDNIWIKSDRNRLYQVFANLTTNAQKFTKDGEIRLAFERKGSQIWCFVSDTGIGIPEDKIDTIFNRFVKVNSSAPGTGLGLAICRSIVEKLGGEIGVESEFGKGTTMFFILPDIVVDPPTRILDTHKEKINRSISKNRKEITVLVVEDIDNDFKLIAAIIGKNYTLIHANNGSEAIGMAKKYTPDIILMDINMPEPNGMLAAKTIKETMPHVTIIGVSAYAYNEDQKRIREYGFDDFMTKPLSKNTLVETIEKYI